MGKPTAAARRIFVAHAAEDRDAFRQLRAHAAALWRKEVRLTNLDDVPAGAEPREAIDGLIDSADAVVVLLSADLLGSELWDHEIGRLLERRPGAPLIPVRLRAVELGGTPFAQMQALPRDGRTVTSHASQDDAWAEIVRALREILATAGRGAPEEMPRETPLPPISSPISPPRVTPLPPPARSEPPLPRKLVEALRDGTLVPFAGAGVSMAVMDAQRPGSPLFPSWAGLLELAAARLEADGKEGDAKAVRGAMERTNPSLLEAARNARDGLREDGWNKFLHDVIDRPRKHARDDSLDLARLLWGLGSSLIITTNHDKVLHWACPDLANLRHHDIQAPADLVQVRRTGEPHPTVWHLYGSVGNKADLILAPDGYERLYPTAGVEARYKAALKSLRTLLTLRTLLFVGVSFDGASLAGQLQWMRKALGGAAGLHYVLVREAEREALRGKVADLPIELVAYADHGAPLVALLRRLAAARAAGGGS